MFPRVHTWGPPANTTGSSHQKLRWETALPCSRELQMCAFEAEDCDSRSRFFFFFPLFPVFCQLVHSWKQPLSRREAVSLNLPIFYFLSLFVFDSSSSAELPHAAETKWKTQLLPLMNRLTVWQEEQKTLPLIQIRLGSTCERDQTNLSLVFTTL